jgi:hypothetical protein
MIRLSGSVKFRCAFGFGAPSASVGTRWCGRSVVAVPPSGPSSSESLPANSRAFSSAFSARVAARSRSAASTLSSLAFSR